MEENCLFVFFKQNIYSILVPQGFGFFSAKIQYYLNNLCIYIYMYIKYMCVHIFINLNNPANLCHSQQPFLLHNREENSNKGQKCSSSQPEEPNHIHLRVAGENSASSSWEALSVNTSFYSISRHWPLLDSAVLGHVPPSPVPQGTAHQGQGAAL